MPALEISERHDGLRITAGEVVGVRDLQLRLFVVFAERVLIEQLMILLDGQSQCPGAKVVGRLVEILVGAEVLLGRAAGSDGGEQ
jgi:hypothetical protein